MTVVSLAVQGILGGVVRERSGIRRPVLAPVGVNRTNTSPLSQCGEELARTIQTEGCVYNLSSAPGAKWAHHDRSNAPSVTVSAKHFDHR